MIGAIIYGALAADGTVAGLVGGRIYPEQAPDEADLPLVVYTVKMGETSPGTAPMWPVTVTVNSYAATDAAAETLTAAVQAALDGFDGVDANYLVRALFLSDYGELRDQDVSIWGRLATFTGWVVRR